MKILVSLLIILLLACVGGAGYFYLTMYQPMVAEMKVGMPELDKTKVELKKYKEKEKKETAWINPAIDLFSAGLDTEVKAGTAEVLSAGNRVVVNIAEQALYMPGSKTFTNESRKLLLILDSLLRSDGIKGKYIFIGNTTQGVQAKGKGKKKTPAKDARTLASERSMELVKYLEKKDVSQDALIAAAYSTKQPEVGFKIKDHKTVIIIENPPLVPMVATKQAVIPQTQSKPTTTIKSTATTSVAPAVSPAPQVQPKPIPIRPAQPKSN
jgi:hypothetical protein